MVPELDIYHKSLFLQHFGHGSKHGSGWFRMVPLGFREIPNKNKSHNALYFVHFYNTLGVVPSMVQDGSGWFRLGEGYFLK